MAERTILVCDFCGEPAVQTVNIKAGNRTVVKDVCERHLTELMEGGRRPRRGRPRGATAKAAATTAPTPRRKRGTRKRAAAARKPRTRRAARTSPAAASSEEAATA